LPYGSFVLLLSLIEDREEGKSLWLIEFDGVLVGRFDSKDEVAAYLRRLGHRVDPAEEWPRHRLL
jgi:hypothetical protein